MTEPWDTYVREYEPINHCEVCGRADYLICCQIMGVEKWFCEECRNPPVFGKRREPK